jgi:hypothetical protein
MKKLLFSFSAAIAFSLPCAAQPWAFTTLDINQAKAGVNSNGDLFWNYSAAQFEVPQDSGTHTIGASAIWIGGLDAGGQLHLAAQTYRQTGNDFYPGPIMTSYSAATDAQWNQLWKINKTTIDTFLLWRANPANFPGYVIPSEIATWPGNGDVQQGQAALLAPFIDVNGDGVYAPNSGDYPCIKGDQAVFFIFNDARNIHTETGGIPLGIEVHGMVYGYSAPGSWLDTTVFLNYKIYNRGIAMYSDVYLGQYTDFDIGTSFDDYAGCDVARSMMYGYNGDAVDGPGAGSYGVNAPAQGVVFLRGPEADTADLVDNNRNGTVDEAGESIEMSHFIAFNNDFTQTGNPENTTHFYNYLNAMWKDGSPLTYGGNGYGGATPGDFMYPGNSDPMGWGTGFPQASWEEVSSGNIPGDRRAVGASGPFTLSAGEASCIDYAYVYGRGTNGPSSSIAPMQIAADSARSFYLSNNPCTCDENPLAVSEPQSSAIGIYPNPATDNINIICGDNATGSTVEIMDVNGNVVKTTTVLSGNSVLISTSDLAAGVYFVRVNKDASVLTGRFIKN